MLETSSNVLTQGWAQMQERIPFNGYPNHLNGYATQTSVPTGSRNGDGQKQDEMRTPNANTIRELLIPNEPPGVTSSIIL